MERWDGAWPRNLHMVNYENYVSEWKDGTQMAKTYTWATGEKYVGEWKDDKKGTVKELAHICGWFQRRRYLYLTINSSYEYIVATKKRGRKVLPRGWIYDQVHRRLSVFKNQRREISEKVSNINIGCHLI